RDANHTTGRRWLHNVGKSISLFVAGVKDKVALKLIAAKGKVQVQTQSDRMEITADKDVTITSCKERVVVNAKQEILVTAGGGYIHIAGGNIEVHCPGTVSVKGTSHDLSGARRRLRAAYRQPRCHPRRARLAAIHRSSGRRRRQTAGARARAKPTAVRSRLKPSPG
ncbi:DUF2345 domain-containing protein, partial [Chromobacterium piscinae]|uniref:DUF2345 domain-containing protein n=1 Tax=Chromobacterium piscinae TaxID=686831 RepID=UPI003261B03D